MTMRRGFTLIELLIVVAMIAVLTSGLALSSTHLMVRSAMTRRAQQMETALAMAIEAIAADVAQAQAIRQNAPGSLEIVLAPGTAGGERTRRYEMRDSMLHRMGREQVEFSQVLLNEQTSGEFRRVPLGMEIVLESRFAMPPREIVRRAEVFLATDASWEAATR